MPKIDFYNATDLNPGDVMVATLTAHVHYDGSIRVYRCQYNTPNVSDEGIPQGTWVGSETIKVEDIFPIIKWAKEIQD